MKLECSKRGHAADWLLYALTAALMLAILMVFAGKKSFFTDELHQIGMLESADTLPGLIGLHAGVDREVVPPLFAVLAWLWYQLVPYGQAWLQLLPAILTCAGVYVTGLAGRALGGRLTGALAALLALIAPAVSLTAGMQFRQYGALFFFSALTAYLYVLRCEKRGNEPWRILILYGVTMAMLPYTHYVSALLPAGFFLIDLVLLIQKRIRPRCLVSYAIGGGLFLPWGLAILRSVAARNEFWIDKPRLSDLPGALYFLTDGETGGPLFYLFLLGCCIAFGSVLAARLRREPVPEKPAFFAMLACVPFFMLGVTFVFSAFISENVSLFLPRYFISAIPVMLPLAAYAAVRLFRLLTARTNAPERFAATVALLLFVTAFSGLRLEATVRTDVGTVSEPYREAADFLCEQPDIYDETTAVVTSNLSDYVTKGFKTYYVTRGGARDAFVIFDYATPFTEADVARYEVLYAFVEHAALPPETQALLREFYEQDGACTDGAQWRVTRYIRRGGA